MDFRYLLNILKSFINSRILKRAIIILLIALIAFIVMIEIQGKLFPVEKKNQGMIPDSNTSSINIQKVIEKTTKSVPREQEFEIITSKIPPKISSTNSNEVIYFFDVETESQGWIVSGMWHVTGKRYSSPDHSFWYGNEAIGDDSNNANSGELISPLINLDNNSDPVFHIHSWYQTNSNNYFDKKIIQISLNNGSWIDLTQVSHEQEKWIEEKIDLSNYRGNKIRFRFFLDMMDNNFNKYEGWYIDDIIINEG